MTQPDIFQPLFKNSDYDLSLFSAREIGALLKKVFTKTVKDKEAAFVRCLIRDKDIRLKPEEIVRQLYATRLIEQYGYQKKRLAFEYSVNFGREKKKR